MGVENTKLGEWKRNINTNHERFNMYLSFEPKCYSVAPWQMLHVITGGFVEYPGCTVQVTKGVINIIGVSMLIQWG